MTSLDLSHEVRQAVSHNERFPNLSHRARQHNVTASGTDLSTATCVDCPQARHDAEAWDQAARLACGITPGAKLPQGPSVLWRQYVAAYDAARAVAGGAL